MCKTWPYKVMGSVLLLEAQLCKGQSLDAEAQEQGLQGGTLALPTWEHQRNSGSTCASREKSRDYTSIVGDLHASVVLSVISVFLQINMYSFVPRRFLSTLA